MSIKDTVKEVPGALKEHFKAHKGAYAMTAVAIAAIALQQSNRRSFYAFLEEKGIDPEEYYCPESYEEKQVA
jgi:hypothetical protein